MSARFLLQPTAFLLVTTLCAVADIDNLRAESWPSFRGPDRSNVAPDKGLLKTWPDDGPKLDWQTAGAGRGYASLAIVGDRIFTLGDAPSTAKDEDEYLICFNRADGKELWKTKTGAPWTEGKPT